MIVMSSHAYLFIFGVESFTIHSILYGAMEIEKSQGNSVLLASQWGLAIIQRNLNEFHLL